MSLQPLSQMSESTVCAHSVLSVEERPITWACDDSRAGHVCLLSLTVPLASVSAPSLAHVTVGG